VDDLNPNGDFWSKNHAFTGRSYDASVAPVLGLIKPIVARNDTDAERPVVGGKDAFHSVPLVLLR
jgi:hypothetical protein